MFQSHFIRIKKIRSTADSIVFHKVARTLNSGRLNWIEPIWMDIEKVFDLKVNPFLTGGNCARWIAVDMLTGNPIGRIAAFASPDSPSVAPFTDPSLSVTEMKGGVGFFESVDRLEVAQALFGAAEAWLREQRVQTALGPINPGEKDSFWGLLIEGFEHAPSYRKSSNPPYYRNLFEQLGYQVDYFQYTFARSLEEGVPAELAERIKPVLANPRYEFRKLGSDSAEDLRTFATEAREIYNAAWTKIPGFKPLSEEQIQNMLGKMKPILDTDLLWRAYDRGKPCGFLIFLPEINSLLKDFKGKLGWFQKIRLFFRLKFNPPKRAIGVVFGILPRYQGNGLAHALVSHAGEQIRSTRNYREFELNWVGSFNPRMIALVESFGAIRNKTFATFRKELNS